MAVNFILKLHCGEFEYDYIAWVTNARCIIGLPILHLYELLDIQAIGAHGILYDNWTVEYQDKELAICLNLLTSIIVNFDMIIM